MLRDYTGKTCVSQLCWEHFLTFLCQMTRKCCRCPNCPLSGLFCKIGVCLALVSCLSSIIKNSHIGHFSHSVFITELEFLIKNDFQSKMLDLKIHHLLVWSISRWLFKFNTLDWKSFLIQNSNSVMKTEWEKCSILSILLIKLKLFKIGRNCAKKINNNPFYFLA